MSGKDVPHDLEETTNKSNGQPDTTTHHGAHGKLLPDGGLDRLLLHVNLLYIRHVQSRIAGCLRRWRWVGGVGGAPQSLTHPSQSDGKHPSGIAGGNRAMVLPHTLEFG